MGSPKTPMTGPEAQRLAFHLRLSGLARAYTTNISEVLCIGLGVGIVPMEFARGGRAWTWWKSTPPSCRSRFASFGPADQPTQPHAGTMAAISSTAAASQYDVVILDAFLGDSSPSHLLTREAFASIHRVLRPGRPLWLSTALVTWRQARLLHRFPSTRPSRPSSGRCRRTPAGTAASSSSPRTVRPWNC